jgi:hypothetical protein
MENSLNELLEIETLTAKITADLRIIRDDNTDLDDLEHQTSRISVERPWAFWDLGTLDHRSRGSGPLLE